MTEHNNNEEVRDSETLEENVKGTDDETAVIADGDGSADYDDSDESAEEKSLAAKTLDGAKKFTKKDRKTLTYLLSTVGLSAFFCAFYYSSLEISSRNESLSLLFPIVMFTYMAVLTALIFAYIIYNRAFSRKGVTAEMLPPEWSDEKKREFIENGELRLKRSKWMLVLIISLLVTFIAEAVTFFVIPMVKGWLGM